MENRYVFQRLEGIQKSLIALHTGGGAMSSASRGAEREDFINKFLSEVLPPVYRFGTGDATDAAGNRSGQLDVVIEYPFSPTLPSIGTSKPTRLYLAEGVASVVEVKSNIAAQWSEVQSTARQLEPLRRKFGASMSMGSGPSDKIPLFAAGYTGWATIDAVKSNLSSNPNVAGVLVVDRGIFVSQPEFLGIEATGSWSLWALICCLHKVTTSLQAASSSPLDYAI